MGEKSGDTALDYRLQITDFSWKPEEQITVGGKASTVSQDRRGCVSLSSLLLSYLILIV
jgi:hypothetical protein